MLEKIKALAKTYFNDTVAIRQHLHAHPELSFEEYNTSEFISSKLKEYNIPFSKGIVKTGIVAIIEGRNPNFKTVAMRADMDALPIIEKNNVPYKSQNEGVMHACGHDVHSASALTAARIIYELKNEIEGTVKVIFQPGEEKLPGGASLMIEEGVLENPAPQFIFAQHVHPSLEAGKVGFRKGIYMASTDEIYITVIGKGGHAAMVNEYNNPLLMASRLLLELHKEVMETLQPYPTVLSFGKISGEGATNVIPDLVRI